MSYMPQIDIPEGSDADTEAWPMTKGIPPPPSQPSQREGREVTRDGREPCDVCMVQSRLVRVRVVPLRRELDYFPPFLYLLPF
jgi:hypothetical protein